MNTKIIIITAFIFLVPRSLPDVTGEPTPENIKELLELKALTEELESRDETFIPPENVLSFDPNLIFYYVYTNEDLNGVQVYFNESNELTSVSSFKNNTSTVFIIHGWTMNYNAPVNVYIRTALFEIDTLNVICVDWSNYGNGSYLESVLSAPNVGTAIGQFIESVSSTYNYSLDDITIIGHSLGGQIAGYVGQETNGTLGTIIGLDPAGPLYFENLPDGRLSPEDAKYVQGIHTNAAFKGVNFNVGHADFWPNGGYVQVGCGTDITGSCSHNRAYEYMAESVTNNQFYARECDSYTNYTNGNCASNERDIMGGPKYDTELTGTFYLKTNPSSPFALGDVNS